MATGTMNNTTLGRNATIIEESREVNIPVVVMLSIFSVVGVIGNALAFYIFFRRRSTSTSVIFILALAGTDFITCLVTIPYTVVFELLSYRLIYDMACKSYMFLITSTVPFSAYIMVAIALDRYFCICHPFLHAFTIPRAKALILCMGIPAITFGTITALSYGAYTHETEYYEVVTDADVTPSSLDHDNLNMSDNSTSYYGYCADNKVYFSDTFFGVYKKVHALNFLVAYLAVAILYIMIYKSIFTRRANKARRKKNNLYPVSGNKMKTQPSEETQMTVIQGMEKDSPKLNNQSRKDAKCARKITLTARNDPTAFVKTGSRSVAISEVQQEDEMANLLPIIDEVFPNEVSAKSPATSDESKCAFRVPESVCGQQTSSNRRRVEEDSNAKNDKFQNGSAKTNETSNNETDGEGGKKTDDETQAVGNCNNSVAPEEAPLLPHPSAPPPQTIPTPPTTLSLKPNAISHQCATDANTAASKKHALGKLVATDGQTNSIKRKRPSTVRDRNLMANIKTAFMLFIVTLVFIVAFLPALLMANGLIPLNLIVFYSYFIYNVANPFIYAFMNQTFREDLKKIISVCRSEDAR